MQPPLPEVINFGQRNSGLNNNLKRVYCRMQQLDCQTEIILANAFENIQPNLTAKSFKYEK